MADRQNPRGRGRGRGAWDGRRGSSTRGHDQRGGSTRGSNLTHRPAQTSVSRLPTAIPDQAITKLENAYGEEILKTKPVEISLPLRPAFGTRGRDVKVLANYFPITCPDKLSFHSYAIRVASSNRSEAKGPKLAQLISLLLRNLRDDGYVSVSTDFKLLLYSTQELAPQHRTKTIIYHDENETTPRTATERYSVTLEQSSQIGLAQLLFALRHQGDKPTDAAATIQLLNILFGHSPKANQKVVSVGDNHHFSLAEGLKEWQELSKSVDAFRGFFQSVRPATGRLLLNVQVKHAAFYKSEKLSKLLQDTTNEGRNHQENWIKNLRIRTTHRTSTENGRVVNRNTFKRISGFADPSVSGDFRIEKFGAGPKEVIFKRTTANGTENISVWDYFQSAYPNVRLTASLPVVNVGTAKKPTFLPSDVCEVVPGQLWKRHLPQDQVTAMIRFAARRPHANIASLEGKARAVLGHDGELLASHGITVGRSLVAVPARLLPQPMLLYRDRAPHKPDPGSWNLKELKVQRSGNISGWAYLRIAYNDSPQVDLPMLTTKFARYLGAMGINLPPLSAQVSRTVRAARGRALDLSNLTTAMKQIAQASTLRGTFVLLVILPSDDSQLYKSVKKQADLTVGIHTVCVQEQKLTSKIGTPQYSANVGLKFNLKSGGVNHTVEKLSIIGDGKTMVVGLDVTHPSPGSLSTARSVAGIVASIDAQLAQWPGSLSIQTGRQEMVDDLESMMRGRLTKWKMHNKSLPENILMYRDGVSEGQYGTVVKEELPRIQAACKAMYPLMKQPRISIVVVGKRHQTRFYPAEESAVDEKNGNCRAGLVVDRGVTEARKWDFFMQAHQSIQGTARPAHYYVVHDEMLQRTSGGRAAAANTLEEITHQMSYLFGRATRAVSICPPAYYADLLCDRARCYLADEYEPEGTGAAEAGSVMELRIHDRLKDSMFYI